MHKFAATETNHFHPKKPSDLLTWKWAVYDAAVLTLIFVGLCAHF